MSPALLSFCKNVCLFATPHQGSRARDVGIGHGYLTYHINKRKKERQVSLRTEIRKNVWRKSTSQRKRKTFSIWQRTFISTDESKWNLRRNYWKQYRILMTSCQVKQTLVHKNTIAKPSFWNFNSIYKNELLPSSRSKLKNRTHNRNRLCHESRTVDTGKKQQRHTCLKCLRSW